MAEARTQALSTLVASEALAAHPGWRVFDCRHDLAKPGWGEEEYRKAHIPGALFAHLDRDLSAAKTGKNGRHPLPDPAKFIAWLGQCGLKSSDTAVCYDQGPGAFAARLWWMLRWVGHDQVAVLDGGLAKWISERRALTPDMPAFSNSSYPGQADSHRSLEVAFIEHNLQKTLLLDARAPARYRGEQEPIDPVAGRIPGALNRFNNDNLNANGTFKAKDQLKREFLALIGNRPAGEIVNYCGSGVAACHNLLAMEHAGLSGSRLYAGSWSEWIAEPRRPRETG